eukprot:jgi/Astpho2/1298/Aster-06174
MLGISGQARAEAHHCTADADADQASTSGRETDEGPKSYGLELTEEQWQPWRFDPLRMEGAAAEGAAAPQSMAAQSGRSRTLPRPRPSGDDSFMAGFTQGSLPKKLLVLLGLIAFSRLGVYLRVPGVDVDAFEKSIKGGGLLGYIDALSGGSISKVGVFSLGIVPYINASIVLQLLATSFPSLKRLQRDEGTQGRETFKQYQKFAALLFAVGQAVGQLSYIRPFVTDFTPGWLLVNTLTLTAGSMVLIHVADEIDDLKLGNGTSLLIFANIGSALPTSVGAALTTGQRSPTNLAIYAAAFLATTLGIVYVQEAERKIPINYANRYRNAALSKQSYLPFKVNATGVMPVIFSSSLLALPTALERYLGNIPGLQQGARALAPNGPLYLPTNIALIAAFNYYYTFLQLEPKDLAEQLKRSGASIPAIRPGRATADYITGTLQRMSILGSAFLGALAAAPAAVEGLTHLQAFRGFAGTSVLILVGVATDTARKVRAEQAMSQYGNLDDLYKDMDV